MVAKRDYLPQSTRRPLASLLRRFDARRVTLYPLAAERGSQGRYGGVGAMYDLTAVVPWIKERCHRISASQKVAKDA